MVQYGETVHMNLIDTIRQRSAAIFTRDVQPTNTRAVSTVSGPGRRQLRSSSGGLLGGGMSNSVSGLGTSLDRNEAAMWTPSYYWNREQLEILRVESKAVKKAIEIPVDDCMIRWRQWDTDDERITEAEDAHMVRDRVARAWKMGRLFGTGLLVMMTREAPMEEPLNIEAIRQGDLLNLLPIDRFRAHVYMRDEDPYSPNFGSALTYRIYTRRQAHFMVHASRVIRFDGISPLDTEGFHYYDEDWGASIVIPILKTIVADQSIYFNSAHLTHEASIPVLQIERYRAALAQSVDAEEDDIHPDELAMDFNERKSIYRTAVMDKTDEFTRVGVQMAGLPQLIDRSAQRVASEVEIPATRWNAQSPLGLNATGDGDAANWQLTVKELQAGVLDPALAILDEVMMRSAGISDIPNYEWRSLLDLSEQEIAQASKTRAEAVNVAVQGGWMDEEEAREAMDGDPVLGDLSGPFEPPEPDDDDGNDTPPGMDGDNDDMNDDNGDGNE